jgi:hypothetical protein
MKSTAKKTLLAAFLLLLAACAWQSLLGDGINVNIDGDEVGGPLGFLLGLMLAGGGLLLAALAIICAALFTGLLFAGVGIALVGALALAALLMAAAVSPLLLPLLIPIALYWCFSARARQRRPRATMEHAV